MVRLQTALLALNISTAWSYIFTLKCTADQKELIKRGMAEVASLVNNALAQVELADPNIKTIMNYLIKSPNGVPAGENAINELRTRFNGIQEYLVETTTEADPKFLHPKIVCSDQQFSKNSEGKWLDTSDGINNAPVMPTGTDPKEICSKQGSKAWTWQLNRGDPGEPTRRELIVMCPTYLNDWLRTCTSKDDCKQAPPGLLSQFDSSGGDQDVIGFYDGFAPALLHEMMHTRAGGHCSHSYIPPHPLNQALTDPEIAYGWERCVEAAERPTNNPIEKKLVTVEQNADTYNQMALALCLYSSNIRVDYEGLLHKFKPGGSS